jgi:hypothetical protein
MIEIVWLLSLLEAAEAHILQASLFNIITTMPMHHKRRKKNHRHKKKDKKEKHVKHHKKLARIAVTHMKHMQKINSAIRAHRIAQATLPVVSGGTTPVKSGENMNEDLISKAGVVRQKIRSRAHAATKPKSLSAQQRINALRHKTHASRVAARKRGAEVFKGR